MTLTLPAEFDAQKFHSVLTGALVVKITNGDGDEFWFSEKGINQGTYEEVVKGLLYDISPITHGYDINTLEYQPAHVTCTISNLWQGVKPNSYFRTRASDILVGGSVLGLWGRSLQVWEYAGGYSTSAEGFLVFDGSIVNIQMDGDDKLSLTCDEIWNTRHRDLPQRKADRATFPNLPVENIDKTLPLVYGPHNEEPVLRNTGFALGLKVDTWKWVFADHTCFAFYDEARIGATSTKALWMYVPELDIWARSYTGVTFNTNDSGRATAVIDPLTAEFDCYLYPGAGATTSTGTDGANPIGENGAFDYDSDTKVSVLANSTTQAEIIFEWHQQGSDTNHRIENGIADMNTVGAGLEGLQMWASKPGGITISSATIDYWNGAGWSALSATVDTATANFVQYTVANFLSVSGVYWHFNTGPTGGDGTPFKVRIRFNGSGWTANSTVVAYIHEIRIVQSIKLPRTIHYKTPKSGRRGISTIPKTWRRIPGTHLFEEPINDAEFDNIGASLQGRKHANEADHAAEPWNDGDQITNPAGAIESILVDELGFDTGDDLDTDSFDVVYNSGTARYSVFNLKPGSVVNSKTLIDRICFEHCLVLYRSRGATPKFKLVEAVGRATLATTIRRSEIAGLPSVHVTPFAVSNILHFKYRLLPHDNQFFKSAIVEDTLSSTEYGDFIEDIPLNTIANSNALPAIQNRLITTNYFRSRPHYIVDFKTVGNRYAALELGDKIQFEAASMDEVLMLYGQSWNLIDFTIFEATVLKDGHAFRAVTQVPEPASMIGEPDCLYPGFESVQNVITGYRATMPERGILERIEACMAFDDSVVPSTPPNEHTFKFAIYTDAATPILVGGTETDEVVYTSPGGEDIRVMGAEYSGEKPTLDPGAYLICIWAKNVNESTTVTHDEIGGTGFVKKTTVYAGTWPGSLTSPTLFVSERISLRLFYTPV